MWTALIAPVVEIIKEWFKNRKNKADAKHAAEMKLIENTATWEQLMAEQAKTSWKDEWFTLLLSAPVVALMWGVTFDNSEVVYRVGLAFNQLDNLPEWYQYLLFVAVTASFGIRGADKLLAIRGKK